jgi:hypothetical protein
MPPIDACHFFIDSVTSGLVLILVIGVFIDSEMQGIVVNCFINLIKSANE